MYSSMPGAHRWGSNGEWRQKRHGLKYKDNNPDIDTQNTYYKGSRLVVLNNSLRILGWKLTPFFGWFILRILEIRDELVFLFMWNLHSFYFGCSGSSSHRQMAVDIAGVWTSPILQTCLVWMCILLKIDPQNAANLSFFLFVVYLSPMRSVM